MTIERPGSSSGDNGANDPYLHDSLASVMDWEANQASEEVNEGSQPLEYDPRLLIDSLRDIQENDPTKGFRINDETQEKVLEVFDQLAGHPEIVDKFLKHPVVSDSPMFENKHMRETLPARHWEKHRGLVTSIQLLAFSLERSPDDSTDVVQAFADSVWSSAETQLGRLESVMRQIDVASSGLTSEECIRVVDAVDLAIRIKREEIAVERGRLALESARAQAEIEERKRDKERADKELRRQKDAEKREVLRQEGEWKDLSEALIQNPEKAYLEYRESRDGVYKGNTLAELSVASRYLAITNGDGEATNTEQAFDKINGHLQILLMSDGEKVLLSKENTFELIEPHLHRFFPTMESLEDLVAAYPYLREDGEFFVAWKKAFTDDKLRKDAEARVGKIDPRLLGSEDITKLEIRAPYDGLGVPYTSKAEMVQDLYKYFINPINGDSDELPAWSKANRDILENCVIAKFPGETLMPLVSPEAPEYKRATKNLANKQWFNINGGIGPDDKPRFYLLLDQVHNFAAFVGKEVAYPRNSSLTVKTELSDLPEMAEINKQDLHDYCTDSDIVPEFGRIDNRKSGGPTEDTVSWALDHNKQPNQAVAALLRQHLGDSNIFYSVADQEPKEKMEGSKVPEAERALQVTYSLDVTSLDVVLKSRDVIRKGVAKFKVATSSEEESRQLNALKRALPQALSSLPPMLH